MAVNDNGAPAARRMGFGRVIGSFRAWWRREVVATVDQAGLVELRREEADVSARFLFMATMSAGIAILGLLLGSPAVIIGAMLIAPLMGPIIGLGFAAASGDYVWLRKCAKAVAVGTLLAVAFTALIVFLSPLQNVTSEIAARTRPNLFDLLVALFSGLAGAYALIRGRAGAVVGVAIATALMPPLAVVGFGLATWNWPVFSGALLLFVTNLVTIALSAAVMARLYGFDARLSSKHTRFQDVLLLVVFLALAVPLGIALRQIAWEAQATRAINNAVMLPFSNSARLSQVDINFAADPVQVTATVLTPELAPEAELQAERFLRRQLSREFSVALTQYQVGTGASAAEEAGLAAARAREEANRRAEDIAARLAVIGGVEPSDVLVDRQNRRAQVRVTALPGASLATYRELEARLIAADSAWRIELVPPQLPLPSVAFADGEPTEAGEQALALIRWAARRRGDALVLRGPQDQADAVAEQLRQTGVADVAVEAGPAPLAASWTLARTAQ
ncbi:DUF389 domain-containing protein [Alteraurantiacibacter palmitatis]|uniref:DUF389 domain-containing protein n=1 Tax=Alteraurantiacibacter palmitatis TaxID=2054628 RepID=A0ABV7E4S3_9SPHN